MRVQKKCKTCNYDPKERAAGGLYKDRREDIKSIKEYIENHEIHYNHMGHRLTPIFKKCCKAFDYYSVKLIKEN